MKKIGFILIQFIAQLISLDEKLNLVNVTLIAWEKNSLTNLRYSLTVWEAYAYGVKIYEG
jgi:hypothetical protein